MIEGQDVHPAFFEDVVDRRLLVRIRSGGTTGAGKVARAFEVPEDEHRVDPGLRPGDGEMASQKSAGS
jgi:hypothetical protein